jgi:hypothetical protein
MGRIAAVLALSLGIAGCDTLNDALAPFDDTSDHPPPTGLNNPERWVYLSRQAPDMSRWVMPKETDEDRARERAEAAAGKPPPRPRYRGRWIEQFDYHILEQPRVPPREYVETFTERMRRSCPDSVTTPLRISDAEVLLEVVTSGCEPFGREDELLRFVFDQPNFVELGYTVKAQAMTPAQRASGMKALYEWKFGP